MKQKFMPAIHGFVHALATDQGVKIQCLLGLVTIIVSWFFNFDLLRWSIVFLCIGLILSLELLNTAIESLCDFIHPDKQQQIKHIKDIAAAAVFIGCVFVAIVYLLIVIEKGIIR